MRQLGRTEPGSLHLLCWSDNHYTAWDLMLTTF
ncbi:unnamed protein product [Larinioides sclopetarius]|uniref:Uncharacterized protein n=1 Tax=Larinioides sclopetarius TaxID=280406 RepID=A0AAV2BBH4_9ARAC